MQGRGNSLGPFFGVIDVLVRALRAAGRLRFPGASRLDERLSMRTTSILSSARFARAGLAFCAGSLAALALASPALADKIKNPTAIFSGLDKITGRIISFEAAVDETVQFGSLQLTARICYSRPEYENPQTTTFGSRGSRFGQPVQEDLRRLDVRLQPRPERDRASGL